MTYPSPVPEPFLRQVANAYLDNEPDSLIDYCFVTPGKRAGIFLFDVAVKNIMLIKAGS